ncbi:MAG: CXXX repeat peptide modification system protein [Lachnospiraceae bacterium]|nr:CXXX repeat peptide modification system protein [Lachnospiraceae bacterium]
MGKTYICDVPELEAKNLLNILEMKYTLESLVAQIAANNDILKEDSLLYTRLVEDYKNIMEEYNGFWMPYLKKYKDIVTEKSELSIDFETNRLFVAAKAI